MYLNISSRQILTKCLFCTKNYVRCSGENTSGRTPDLCSQSCIERLNEHEIAKQCNVETRVNGRQQSVDFPSRFQGAQEWRELVVSGNTWALPAEFEGRGQRGEASPGQARATSPPHLQRQEGVSWIWSSSLTKLRQTLRGKWDKMGVVRSQMVSNFESILLAVGKPWNAARGKRTRRISFWVG